MASRWDVDRSTACATATGGTKFPTTGSCGYGKGYTEIFAPAEVFYAIGAIEYTVRYSLAEARKLVIETGHAGPWDDKINSAVHAED